MQINGWAFSKDETEISQRYRQRFKEISHLRKDMSLTKNSQYGRTQFSGALTTPESRALSELDIALIADHGNLCFGGECTKIGDQFFGSYNVD